MIHIANALWGDVFVVADGVIGCAYDLGTRVLVELFKLIDDKPMPIGELISFDFDEHVLFVVGAKNGVNEIVVMGQGNDSGRFLAQSTKGFIPRLLTTYGTHSVAVMPTQGSFDYVVQVGPTTFYDSFTNSIRPIPPKILGTSNGIIQLWNDEIVWADLVRTAIPNMYYPFRQADVYVGEGASDPPHIQALERGVQKNIYNGFAARPRAAYDVVSNTFAVAARAENGVDFHFFRRPLKDLSVVIPPIEPPIPPVIPPVEPDMPCTPVVPPQDVVKRSLDDLRQFCQNYVAPDNALPEYAGKKPYVNDEIHENGLFIADGLIYFMMSDTGRWAQVLMNPDDKRDWETKRHAADKALQDYMKARVGDKPASTMPGGAMSGDVNVG